MATTTKLTEPVLVYRPCGHTLGVTDDPWTAAVLQRAGFIAL